MNDHDFYMTEVEPEVFLHIGRSLLKNEPYNNYTDDNFKKKSLQEYKTEYLQKLYIQLDDLSKKRAELLDEYKLCTEFNKTSIDKITYFNKKLGKNNNNHYHHSSTVSFLSLRMKKVKSILNETIKNNIINSQKLYELEKEICSIDLRIHKTKYYIDLNT